jgi:hypothetical protein
LTGQSWPVTINVLPGENHKFSKRGYTKIPTAFAEMIGNLDNKQEVVGKMAKAE